MVRTYLTRIQTRSLIVDMSSTDSESKEGECAGQVLAYILLLVTQSRCQSPRAMRKFKSRIQAFYGSNL